MEPTDGLPRGMDTSSGRRVSTRIGVGKMWPSLRPYQVGLRGAESGSSSPDRRIIFASSARAIRSRLRAVGADHPHSNRLISVLPTPDRRANSAWLISRLRRKVRNWRARSLGSGIRVPLETLNSIRHCRRLQYHLHASVGLSTDSLGVGRSLSPHEGWSSRGERNPARRYAAQQNGSLDRLDHPCRTTPDSAGRLAGLGPWWQAADRMPRLQSHAQQLDARPVRR